MLRTLALALFLGCASSAWAQCVSKYQGQLVPPDGAPYAEDGPIGLTMSGNRAFCTIRAISGGNPIGCAQEFVRQPNGTWLPGQRILPPASLGNNKDHFAERLALDGDRLVIGSTELNLVWIYERNAGLWTQAASFSGQGTTSGSVSEFGITVAIDGDLVAVGEPMGDHPTLGVPGTGLVHVYERLNGTWSETQKLVPNTAVQNARFGECVVVNGGSIFASSSGDPNPPFGTGAIYEFERPGSTWVQASRFGASTGTGVILGREFAYSGSTCIAISEQHGTFVFERAGPFWFQSQNLIVGATHPWDRIAIDGDRIAVGHMWDAYVLPQRGSVHLFERESGVWVPRSRIRTPESVGGTKFGRTIALRGDTLLVHCAELGTPPSTTLKGVMSFSAVPNPKPFYGAGCPGTGNVVPSIDDLATYDGCFFDGDSVTYRIANGLGGSACVLLISAGQAQLPLQGACSLLVSPAAVSLVVPLFGVGPGGGSITLNSSIPVGVPSASIFMQAFVLDGGAPGGFAATNGMRLTVQ